MPDVNTIRVNTIENEIIGIISNPSVHTQLVYGLIPSTRWSIQLSSNQPTGNLDEVTEMKALIAANLMLIRKTHKPIVLFLPQNIAQKYEFIQNLTNYHNKVGYCDLTKGLFALQLIENSDIIIVHTGPLQSQFFDYLLLKGTTLPPVIEGCNSRELCEFAGRSFIYGSSIHAPLKEYPVVDVEKQKLHKEASACLKTGDPSYLPQLVQYMNESLTSDPKLVSYHKQRQAAFLARPDAVEVTLGVLGIECRNTLSFQFSQKIQVLPSLKSQVKKNKAKQKSRKCCVLL